MWRFVYDKNNWKRKSVFVVPDHGSISGSPSKMQAAKAWDAILHLQVVSKLRRVSPLKASQVEVAFGAKFSTCRLSTHDIKQKTHVAYRMTFSINYRQLIVWDFSRVMWFLPLQCGDFQSTLSGKTLFLRENYFSVVIFSFFPSRWTWKSLFLKRCKKKARPNEFLITLTRSNVRTAPRKSRSWHRLLSEIKFEIGNFSSEFMTCAVKCSWWI